MLYAIVQDGKLQVWDTDLERIRFTVQKTMPFLDVEDIRSYEDEAIEVDFMGEKWLKGHAPQKPKELLEKEIRAERDELLMQADIAINKAEDAGQDTAALRAYRQALRDIPQQPGFPEAVLWPEQPQVAAAEEMTGMEDVAVPQAV